MPTFDEPITYKEQFEQALTNAETAINAARRTYSSDLCESGGHLHDAIDLLRSAHATLVTVSRKAFNQVFEA